MKSLQVITMISPIAVFANTSRKLDEAFCLVAICMSYWLRVTEVSAWRISALGIYSTEQAKRKPAWANFVNVMEVNVNHDVKGKRQKWNFRRLSTAVFTPE